MHPKEAVETCQAMGLGITFTEHVDFNTPNHGFNAAAKDKPVDAADFLTDFSRYPKEYEKYQSSTVLLGLELGMTAYYLPITRQTALAREYDFILGAVHFVDGYDLYHDGSNTFDYDRKLRSLTYSLEMVKIYDFIDAFGHIDYVSRYTPAPDKNAYYDDYAAEYDALLQMLAERDIAIEINTSRFGAIPGLEKNLARVYKRFYQLGGRYCTIGSDAHNLQALGHYHKEAVNMARECELTPAYFKKRKRELCK
jgi:histidinol-phosphatase (PHP family)